MKEHTKVFASFLVLLLSVGALADPGRLVIYASEQAVITDGSGAILGQTGKPFRIEMPPQDEAELKFVLQADGFQPLEINSTAGKLRTVDRLPAQGSYSLRSERNFTPFLLLIPIMLVVGFVIQRNRRASEPNEPALPPSDDAFTLGSVLGKGATSTIYSGTAPGLEDQNLAIKILAGAQDEEMAKRFLRSLQSTMELNHPNLVKIHRSGRTEKGEPYLIMERLEGSDLKSFLKETPKPEKDRILSILGPLCQVLGYLHEHGIVHRDVKPDNIFLLRDGGLKLMDLEISRAEDAEDLTATGIAIGTPFYISPEQAQGRPGPASDQYSVGVLLFEMLAGKRPFRGRDAVEVIGKHISAPIPSLCEFAPEATSLQEAVVRKLLAKRPESRFDNIGQALESITEALSESDGEQTGTVY